MKNEMENEKRKFSDNSNNGKKKKKNEVGFSLFCFLFQVCQVFGIANKNHLFISFFIFLFLLISPLLNGHVMRDFIIGALEKFDEWKVGNRKGKTIF